MLKTKYSEIDKADLRRDWEELQARKQWRNRRQIIIILLMAIGLVCFWPNYGICLGIYVNAVTLCWRFNAL